VTARHKDFGSEGVFRSEDLEPISFDLLGQTYNCQPTIPGAVLLRFIARTGTDQMSATADEFLAFFVHALVPADYERFEAVINDRDIVVSADTLTSIVSWLIEQYGERPTQRQLPSVDGPSITGLTSEAGTSPSGEPLSTASSVDPLPSTLATSST
jgi:hypothetical protein